MSSSTPEFLERFRQPEYTGRNRCMPCTIVNSVIAVVLAAVVGAGLATVGSAGAGVAGAVGVLAVSALSIGLRGYLVPGTPTLTKRYLPDRVLRLFDKEPADLVDREVEEDESGWEVEVDGEKVERILQSAGALEECETVDDLCVTDSFQEVWWGHIEDVRDSDAGRDELARILDADPDVIEFEDFGGAFAATKGDRRVGKWESEAAFLADMGAARALKEVDGDRWEDLHIRERSAVLNGVRVFLERCPVCEGLVTLGEETVESCCREYDVMAVGCEDCGARLFESEHEPAPMHP